MRRSSEGSCSVLPDQILVVTSTDRVCCEARRWHAAEVVDKGDIKGAGGAQLSACDILPAMQQDNMREVAVCSVCGDRRILSR